ncbi:hypothetical protein C0992_001396 [Termitomyces sp. T32_za158]|nr:hypothetical protein C0992_001396 [Termitomyces sp. T32_za158]
MFRRHSDAVFLDLSSDLRDIDAWKIGPLRVLEYLQNITAFASEPISGLLAIDETNILHIWDLTAIGRPRLAASARFDATNATWSTGWFWIPRSSKSFRKQKQTKPTFYLLQDLLTHRRPEVTAITIHPTGHFFAVGYADGSLAFWAVNDDTPLLVRTLDDVDVNLVDQGRLDEQITRKAEGKPTRALDREPVFKLSWSGFPNSSDPRGGKTTLAILGGQNIGEPPGLTVIQFSAFNPPEPPVLMSPTPGQPALHPVIRQTMRDSLEVLDSYFYFTQGVIQDYLLVPRNNPHFAGTFDPIAILLLAEGEGTIRTLEAYQYPPPAFSLDVSERPVPAATATVDPLSSLENDFIQTLKELEENDDPQRLLVPTALLHGNSGVLGGQLLTLERETYQTLAAEKVEDSLLLPLKGGQAWADEFQANDLRFAKFQPNRILVTWHRDLTICFEDLSAQLLIVQRPTPLQTNFPKPFLDLIIDLRPVLLDPFVNSQTSPIPMDHIRIDSVRFSIEALEAIVVLTTGEVILYRLSGPRKPGTHKDVLDKELVVLEHIPSYRGFSPFLMLSPELGPTEAYAVSDIGLLAVAYSNSLFIVDTRGPDILLRHFESKDSKSKHVAGLIPAHSGPDRVASMVWCISQLAKDPELQVRLVVTRKSGRYSIYTLIRSGHSTKPWSCDVPITSDGGVQHALPRGTFVVDSKTGAQSRANHNHLAQTGSGGPRVPSIFVMVGTKGARCFANINGDRISKTEWGHKAGEVLEAQIVEKLAAGASEVAAAAAATQATLYGRITSALSERG